LTSWGGVRNGDLLRLAEGQFDLFIPSDQNIRYQQNLASIEQAGKVEGVLKLV
jgi:hypothetical protein